jgi:membrane protease YdiL (CAAX protease family)
MTTLDALETTATIPRSATIPDELRPIPLWKSALVFGVSALTFVLAFHFVRPWLLTVGLTPFESLVVAITVPMSWLFGAALVGYAHIESRPLVWSALAERFRFPRLTLRAVLAGLGLFALCMVGMGVFSQLGLALIGDGIIPIPSELPPLVDPRVQFSLGALEEFVGGTLSGNWNVALAFFVMLFFNVVGEELLWRGYLLPRQELTHGRRAWLVQGLMWTGFHVYQWWSMIALLPVCLLIAYASQRLRNNWPALIAHYLLNGLAFAMILMAVMS